MVFTWDPNKERSNIRKHHDGFREAELKVFHDRDGQTLTVWFGRPEDEHVCEETGDEVGLMKDSAGPVIGFEKLNFAASGSEPLSVSVEMTPA